MLFRSKYNRAPGNSIDNVSFTDITIDGASAKNILPSRIEDYDDAHSTGSYTIKNVKVGNLKFDTENDIVRNKQISK